MTNNNPERPWENTQAVNPETVNPTPAGEKRLQSIPPWAWFLMVAVLAFLLPASTEWHFIIIMILIVWVGFAVIMLFMWANRPAGHHANGLPKPPVPGRKALVWILTPIIFIAAMTLGANWGKSTGTLADPVADCASAAAEMLGKDEVALPEQYLSEETGTRVLWTYTLAEGELTCSFWKSDMEIMLAVINPPEGAQLRVEYPALNR